MSLRILKRCHQILVLNKSKTNVSESAIRRILERELKGTPMFRG